MKTKLKRLTATLLLSMSALMLNACNSNGKETDKPKIDLSQPIVAEVTADSFSCGIELSRSSEAVWSGKIITPDTIEGLSICSTGSNAELQYMGLSYTAKSDSLPDNSVIGVISSALDHALSSSDAKAVAEGKDIAICGELDLGQYELYVTKSGEPLSLKVGNSFEAKFS